MPFLSNTLGLFFLIAVVLKKKDFIIMMFKHSDYIYSYFKSLKDAEL